MRVWTILDEVARSSTSIASITSFLLSRGVVVVVLLTISLFPLFLLRVLLGIPGFLHHCLNKSQLFHHFWVRGLGSFGCCSSHFLVVFQFSFCSSGCCEDVFIGGLCSIQIAQRLLQSFLQTLVKSIPQATLDGGFGQLSWMVTLDTVDGCLQSSCK